MVIFHKAQPASRNTALGTDKPAPSLHKIFSCWVKMLCSVGSPFAKVRFLILQDRSL